MHYLWYTFYLKMPDLIKTTKLLGGGGGDGSEAGVPPPAPPVVTPLLINLNNDVACTCTWQKRFIVWKKSM